MAKKTVATLQTSTKKMSKVIKMERSPKSGAYVFVEKIVVAEEVDSFFKK
ncbi:MAG: DUF4295 domain-containing protein [Flavobacteriaceae bacterium]|nr:MAG: DUF4295 domain-containing protein [Flavobacteriaceae bacterium]